MAAFAMVSGQVWLVENFDLQRRHDDVIALFDHLLAARNDLGLLFRGL